MQARLRAYRGELCCTIPLALLVLCGIYGALWWAYAVLLVILALTVLLCNPFCVLDRVLDPRARILLAVGLVVGLLPLAWPLAPLASLVLWALAAGLWAVALWRRRLWLGLYRVRQSPDVDTVLSHQGQGGDWEAGRAWEQRGCRETRALLHQAMETECNEAQIHRTYMPVYLLGYLHGAKIAAGQTSKAAATQATAIKQENRIRELEAEVERLKERSEYYRKQADEQRDEVWQYSKYAADLKQQLDNYNLPQAERDAAILALVEAGSTIEDAGKQYGLGRSGAASAVKRAKAAKEAAES